MFKWVEVSSGRQMAQYSYDLGVYNGRRYHLAVRCEPDYNNPSEYAVTALLKSFTIDSQ